MCFFARRREFDEQFFDLQRALGRQAAQTLVRVRLQRQLEHLALHDPLTGLANRQLLQQSLDALIEDSQRADEPLTLVFFDVDDFKSVNDRWGHRAGDVVLCELAERLRRRRARGRRRRQNRRRRIRRHLRRAPTERRRHPSPSDSRLEQRADRRRR